MDLRCTSCGLYLHPDDLARDGYSVDEARAQAWRVKRRGGRVVCLRCREDAEIDARMARDPQFRRRVFASVEFFVRAVGGQDR